VKFIGAGAFGMCYILCFMMRMSESASFILWVINIRG